MGFALALDVFGEEGDRLFEVVQAAKRQQSTLQLRVEEERKGAFASLVVQSHQSVLNVTELQLQPGIEQCREERVATVRPSAVVAVRMSANGHQTADRVVGRLDEMGGFEACFALQTHLL